MKVVLFGSFLLEGFFSFHTKDKMGELLFDYLFKKERAVLTRRKILLPIYS